MHAELEVYFVLASSRIYGEENFELRARLAEELSSLDSPLGMADFAGSQLYFSIREVSRENAPAALAREGHRVWVNRFFLATASIEIDPADMKLRNPAIVDISDAELAYHIATESGEKFLGDLVFVANLAKPGSLELADSIMMIRGYDCETSHTSFRNDLSRMVKRARELGWPLLKELQVAAIWDWAQGLPGFSDGLIPGRIGRALSAASFLVTAESEGAPADLTWALMGLEALFSRGTQGLKAQIIEKSAVMLGRPTAFRRRFDGIYDYRSRFVHGDLDVPLAHCRHFETGPIATFDSEVDDCTLLASAILFATLQQIAERGWSTLEFTYQLKDPSDPREA